MSQYITNKMALAGSTICDEVRASGQYAWNSDGKCINKQTGKAYPGDQSQSNCTCLGPAPQTGWGGVLDFGKGLLTDLIKPAQQQYSGPQGRPSGALTASGMIVPAAVVVGGVALLLILKKKK